MKKFFTLIIVFIISVSINAFGQTNATVPLSDNVYEVLRSAEIKGLCSPLSLVKPYTQQYIVNKLNEIYEKLDEDERYDEADIIEKYISNFELEDGVQIKKGYIKLNNYSMDFPTTLVISDSLFINCGAGLYANSNQNSVGWEVFNNFNFKGDLGDNVSFKCNGLLGLTRMPLQYMGEYDIGKWWYNDTDQSTPRKIKTYRNNSFLPYSYSKIWDGSTYYITNLYSDGLEGWPVVTSLSFGMSGDIHASFYDNSIELGVGRYRREWGAMDDSSSLIMNSHARPFLGAEIRVAQFDFLSLSSLTGILEFPNQGYINDGAWYNIDDNGTKIGNNLNDSYYFQNAFSILMFDLSLKKIHFDFGSTCIWPKRFELGYAFPLIDNVVYQNDVGDYDNLALFANVKYTFPGICSLWISGYLDEINAFNSKFWEKTRAMFAFQGGIKADIPFIPFTTASFRYTKVEPYCYTHHAINYTPWYNHYISESYTNNGECLGYYLQPNSDELNFQVISYPMPDWKFEFQYQLIRHGVDWGSKAGIGNNLYSELQVANRGDLYKYFLHDGLYEWSHIVSINASYDFNNLDLPIKLTAGLGYIYDYFTDIDGQPGRKTKYHSFSSDEYPVKNGVVGNILITVFYE